MKIFKKILTVFVAFIMAFAVFAFSACDEFQPDNGDNIGNEGGDGEQDKEPVKESELLQAVLNDDRRSVKIEVEENVTGFEDLYNFDSDSWTVGELIESEQEVEYKNTLSGIANLDDGDMDGNLSQLYKHGGDVQSGESPVYIRGYQGFLPIEEEGYEDYMGIDKTAYEYIVWGLDRWLDIYLPDADEYPEDITTDDINDAVSDVFFRLFKAENYTLLKLAENYGLLEVQGNKATVDVNKLAYSILSEVKSYLETLDEATTIGEILKNETVKKILLPFTEVMDAVEMRDVLTLVASYYGLFNFMSRYELDVKLIEDALGTPVEGANAYEYLLSVASSEKTRTAVNAILKKLSELDETEYDELPWTVDKVPLDYILEVCGAGEGAFTEFKDEILEIITDILERSSESLFDLTVGEGTNNVYTHLVANAIIEFTLDSKGVASQKIAADWTYIYGNTSYQKPDQWRNLVTKANYEAVLDFSSKAYELENIDGKRLQRYEYDAIASETKEVEIPVEDAAEPVKVKLQSVVNDNSIDSVKVFTADGEPIELNIIENLYNDLGVFNLKVNCIDGETGETVERDVAVIMKLDYTIRFHNNKAYNCQLRISLSLEFEVNDYLEIQIGKIFEHVYFEPPVYENTVKGFLNGDPFVPAEN